MNAYFGSLSLAAPRPYWSPIEFYTKGAAFCSATPSLVLDTPSVFSELEAYAEVAPLTGKESHAVPSLQELGVDALMVVSQPRRTDDRERIMFNKMI